MLSNGTLTDFIEGKILNKTEIFGNIAQRSCQYEKSGKLNGVPFASVGTKTIQFIKVKGHWKMSAVAWNDRS